MRSRVSLEAATLCWLTNHCLARLLWPLAALPCCSSPTPEQHFPAELTVPSACQAPSGAEVAVLPLECFCMRGDCPATLREALIAIPRLCAQDDCSVLRIDGCGVTDIAIGTGLVGENYTYRQSDGILVGAGRYADCCGPAFLSTGIARCESATPCVLSGEPVSGTERCSQQIDQEPIVPIKAR